VSQSIEKISTPLKNLATNTHVSESIEKILRAVVVWQMGPIWARLGWALSYTSASLQPRLAISGASGLDLQHEEVGVSATAMVEVASSSVEGGRPASCG
jgi:hypothetical protein